VSRQIFSTKVTGSTGSRVLKNITSGRQYAVATAGRFCLQHWVSSLTDVNRGLVDGLRMSASSLLISASISSSSSPESSPVATPFVCSGVYTFVAYYHRVRTGRLGLNTCIRESKQGHQPPGIDPAGRRRSSLLSSWRRWPKCRYHQVGSPVSPLLLYGAHPIAFCPILLLRM
jgi:hypothetical protein